jgi:hypothetical protein
MQLGQTIRRTGAGINGFFQWFADRFTVNERGTGWRLTRRVLIAAAASVPLYYFVGMWWVHRIDDDPNFTLKVTEAEAGSSRAVAMTAALIEREVEDHGWVSNDPIFFASFFNDNMRNYQQGLFAALGRFTVEMVDFLGRARGTSEADTDLNTALEIKSPPDIWVWEPHKSIWPRETSEQRYLRSASALRSYNERLMRGQAVYDRRADNLANTLDRISADIGSSSDSLFRVATQEPGWFLFDWKSDDIFYQTKGRAYGYLMVLRELQVDFDRILREKELAIVYGRMLESFQQAIEMDPFVVVNGKPGSQFVPNHLTTQGFYLLRARTQLKEIASILRA